jgi:hydrogenase nickel incorporation protein HypB
MCATCGCSVTHEHTHEISLEQKVLARNDLLAEKNREWLADRDVLAVNLMSSPGSGKTTLLERTIRDLDLPMGVIEGDQETKFDADRIAATGAPAYQINTGTGCHLDAAMLAHALDHLAPAPGSLVFIENVGNLVCPALFDLGEAARVVIMSVPEGPDKPLKYPHMFQSADLILLNKIDLLPYLDFPMRTFTDHVRKVNPHAQVIPLSATLGAGTEAWYAWLRRTVLNTHRRHASAGSSGSTNVTTAPSSFANSNVPPSTRT